MTRFGELLRVLAEGGVEFVIIGGVAAAASGSPRFTEDLDIVYSRSAANLTALAGALAPYKPHLRGAPAGLPFRLDAETLRAGLNFTLVTDLGWIDLLGEVTGGGRYEDLVPHSVPVQMAGTSCRVLNLEMLIRLKRAAGRPKDFESLAELELLLKRRPR